MNIPGDTVDGTPPESDAEIIAYVRHLGASLHLATREENATDFAYFDRQLVDLGAEHASHPVITAIVAEQRDYPYDKGIPKFHSRRWIAIRCEPRPQDLPAALASRELLPSDLNNAERRALGVTVPKIQLERFGY